MPHVSILVSFIPRETESERYSRFLEPCNFTTAVKKKKAKLKNTVWNLGMYLTDSVIGKQTVSHLLFL